LQAIAPARRRACAELSHERFFVRSSRSKSDGRRVSVTHNLQVQGVIIDTGRIEALQRCAAIIHARFVSRDTVNVGSSLQSSGKDFLNAWWTEVCLGNRSAAHVKREHLEV
jgi:hypothetical protein